jgi:hypothetical protein
MKKITLFVIALAVACISFEAQAQKKETAAQKAQREKMEAVQRELDALKNDKARAEEAAKKEQELIANLPEGGEIILTGHIQMVGDQTAPIVTKPTIGTKGLSRRLEGFGVKVNEPSLRDKLSVNYTATLGPSLDSDKAKRSADCRNTKSGKDGEFAGSKGSSCEVVAISITLSGDYAKYYSVNYKVHQATNGDSAEAKDGATCGTGSKRIEELTVWLTKKNK